LRDYLRYEIEIRGMNIVSYKTHRKILNEIGRAIHQIQYGEVIVTIHNGKIVQIEKREKKRFEK